MAGPAARAPPMGHLADRLHRTIEAMRCEARARARRCANPDDSYWSASEGVPRCLTETPGDRLVRQWGDERFLAAEVSQASPGRFGMTEEGGQAGGLGTTADRLGRRAGSRRGSKAVPSTRNGAASALAHGAVGGSLAASDCCVGAVDLSTHVDGRLGADQVIGRSSPHHGSRVCTGAGAQQGGQQPEGNAGHAREFTTEER